MPAPIYPSALTVIIRDESPMMAIGEPCKYRRVTVKLTPEQADSLQLRYTGKQGGNDTHEEFNQAFLEF